MGFYDDEKTALKYIRMAEGYDGRELISQLRKYLPVGSSVLELGMGPGTDLDLLGKYFRATGSDYSKFFIELYRENNPRADLLVLDAVKLDTDRRFDAIYSNKVLHHLDSFHLEASFARQPRLLEPGGIICHSFWQGEKTLDQYGLHFQERSREEIRALVESRYDVLHLDCYDEMDRDDSLLLIARLK